MHGKLGIDRDVCAERKCSVRARPEVCACDDGCSPNRDDVRRKLWINRDVCAERKSSVRARPEVCARDDGCSPNRDVVRGKLI